MPKFFSERNLVIVLFVVAFVVFFFAQQETRKQEQMHLDLNASSAPALLPPHNPAAENIVKDNSRPNPAMK